MVELYVLSSIRLRGVVLIKHGDISFTFYRTFFPESDAVRVVDKSPKYRHINKSKPRRDYMQRNVIFNQYTDQHE